MSRTASIATKCQHLSKDSESTLRCNLVPILSLLREGTKDRTFVWLDMALPSTHNVAFYISTIQLAIHPPPMCMYSVYNNLTSKGNKLLKLMLTLRVKKSSSSNLNSEVKFYENCIVNFAGWILLAQTIVAKLTVRVRSKKVLQNIFKLSWPAKVRKLAAGCWWNRIPFLTEDKKHIN